jgi:hypothetical protein
MKNKYLLIGSIVLVMSINSCKSHIELIDYNQVNCNYFIPYDIKEKETLFLIKYYYSPFKITDTCLFVPIVYAEEAKTRDTIRIICLESPNIKLKIGGYLEFIHNKHIKKQNLSKKIYIKGDSIYCKRSFKTVFGNIKFLKI